MSAVLLLAVPVRPPRAIGYRDRVTATSRIEKQHG
jgi:hypothetical protein